MKTFVNVNFNMENRLGVIPVIGNLKWLIFALFNSSATYFMDAQSDGISTG
jgi:hypothetical protein